jgi:hypothetical protein
VHALLAAAKPAKLLNFHRQPLSEEKNETYTPVAGQAYRALPFEISFTGPESSMREFINGLQSSKDYFYVIRTMRVVNEKQEGPKASDVEFDVKPAAGAGAATGGGIFESGDAFVLPEDPPPAAGGAAAPGATPAQPEPAPAPEPEPEPEPAPKADSSRILKQVLGSENVQVFLRVDLLLFDAPAPATK